MSGTGSSTDSNAWDPAVYEKFAAERAQPFFDLVSLCQPIPGGRAVDLGCGTGELTAEMQGRLGSADTTGVDNSPAMLAKSTPFATDRLRFVNGDIAVFGAEPADRGQYDLVFSNAALQWAGRSHVQVLECWRDALRPGGQLAVQVPSNADHVSHLTAAEVACEQPFLGALDGSPPADPVLSVLRPEAYAELLHRLGFAHQNVRLQVYAHLLPSTAAVVDWVSGTSLTRFRSRLDTDTYAAFVARYRERLIDALGQHEPYFYAFKRVLFWARLP